MDLTLYIKGINYNLAAETRRHPQIICKEIEQAAGCSADVNRWKLTGESIRITCENLIQCNKLLTVNELAKRPVVVTRPWCVERVAGRRQHDAPVFTSTQVHSGQVDSADALHCADDTGAVAGVGTQPTQTSDTDRVSLGVVYGVPEDISTEKLAADNACKWVRRLTQQAASAAHDTAQSTSHSDHLDTYTALLAFTSDRPNSIVVMEFLRLKVHEYIPRPMRCSNCWAFGHLGKHCSNTVVCEHCGLRGHSKTTCRFVADSSKAKCVNCKDNHEASSRQCNRYKDNLSILKHAYSFSPPLPFKQAQVSWLEVQRKQTAETHSNCDKGKPAIINGKRSYANAVRNENFSNHEILDPIKKDIQLNHDILDSLRNEMHAKDEIIERLCSNSICLYQGLRPIITRGPADAITTSVVAMIDQLYIDMLDIQSRHKINFSTPTPKVIDIMGKVSLVPLSQLNQNNMISLPLNNPQQTPATEPTHPSKVPEPMQIEKNPKVKDAHQENPVHKANYTDGPKPATDLQKPANYGENLQIAQQKETNQIIPTQTKSTESTQQPQEITSQIQKDNVKIAEDRLVQLKVTPTGSNNNGQIKMRQFNLTDDEFDGFIKSHWYFTYYKPPQQGQKSIFLTITDTQYAELKSSPWYMKTYES
jgi:hypothetical protein